MENNNDVSNLLLRGNDGNDISSMLSKISDLLVEIAKGLVQNKDSVNVNYEENEEGTFVYHLSVSDEDKGRVIGRQGRIAKAIRVIIMAAANRMRIKVNVEIN